MDLLWLQICTYQAATVPYTTYPLQASSRMIAYGSPSDLAMACGTSCDDSRHLCCVPGSMMRRWCGGLVRRGCRLPDDICDECQRRVTADGLRCQDDGLCCNRLGSSPVSSASGLPWYPFDRRAAVYAAPLIAAAAAA